MYLLDANTLITAKNSYYQMDFFPAFWDWLRYENEIGNLSSIDYVYNELKDGDDELADWAKANKQFFISTSSNNIQSNFGIIVNGVSSDNSKKITNVNNFLAKADPWLIATALTLDKAVVTLETPGGGGTKKVKIPDVCDTHQVKWLTTFEMLSALKPKFGLV